MKKLLIFALILSMALCVASCKEEKEVLDNSGKIPADTQTTSPDAEQKKDKMREDLPTEHIKLNVADETVSVGDVFSVMVSMENKEWTWSSFEFIITFDPDVIEITDLKPTEFTEKMLNMGNMEYKPNAVKAAFATAADLTGGGDILEIECKAKKSGTSMLELSDEFIYCCIQNNATGEFETIAIPIDIKNGTVTVG